MKNKSIKSFILVLALSILIGYAHYYMTDVYNEVLNYTLVKDELLTSEANIIINAYDEIDDLNRRYTNPYKIFSYQDFLNLKEKVKGDYTYYISDYVYSNDHKYNRNLIFMDVDDLSRIFNKTLDKDTIYVNNEIYKNSDKLINFGHFYIKNKKLFFNDDVAINIDKFPTDKKLMIDQTTGYIIYPSRFQTIDIISADIPYLQESIIMPMKYFDKLKNLFDNGTDFVKINLNGTNGEKLISEINRMFYSRDYKYDTTREILEKDLITSFKLVDGLDETKSYMEHVVTKNILRLIVSMALIVIIIYLMNKKYLSTISFILGLGLSIYYRWKIDEELYLLWLHAQIYVLITFIVVILMGVLLSKYKFRKEIKTNE